ncbi:hypothetical protein J2X71_005157 [Rhizobium sp. 1399]|jgi:hypothetical protein|nr:hypothetical protein [Rhizobium sp. 1399]
MTAVTPGFLPDCKIQSIFKEGHTCHLKTRNVLYSIVSGPKVL